MKTRSVKSSQVPGLSTRFVGSDGLSPSLPASRCLGPMAPRLRKTEDAPNPPLNAKVTGRFGPSTVYAVTTTSPATLPSPSRTGSAPTLTVYFNAIPSYWIVSWTWASAGSGGKADLSDDPLSAGLLLSAAAGALSFCENIRPGPKAKQQTAQNVRATRTGKSFIEVMRLTYMVDCGRWQGMRGMV